MNISQRTSKKLFYIIGSIFLLALLLIFIGFLVSINPALLPPFPAYQNSTKLELKYPLEDPKNIGLLSVNCEGDSFLAKELQAYGVNSEEVAVFTFYNNLASEKGLEQFNGDQIFNNASVRSSCFAGDFNRKRPTNIVTVLDARAQREKTSEFFTSIPPNTSLVILIIQGYITYI